MTWACSKLATCSRQVIDRMFLENEQVWIVLSKPADHFR